MTYVKAFTLPFTLFIGQLGKHVLVASEGSDSVQSWPHFCFIDVEYSILMQNEIIGESY